MSWQEITHFSGFARGLAPPALLLTTHHSPLLFNPSRVDGGGVALLPGALPGLLDDDASGVRLS